MQRITFALAFVIASFTASAQGIIPFLGGNLSGYQVHKDNWSSSGVPGLNLGAVADLKLSHHFYLQPGLEYAMVGGKITYTYVGIVAPPTRYKYTVHSLQLPVMMVLKTGDEEHDRFFAAIGFYVAANLGGQLHADQTAVNPWGVPHQFEYKKYLQFDGTAINSIGRFDFGLRFGVGYHMAAGPELYLFYQKAAIDMLSHSYLNKSTTYQLGISARYALKWSPKHTHSKKHVNHK